MIDKKLYEKTMATSMLFHDLKRELDEQVSNEYGFHYSDENLDYIIDSLDYGLSNLPFKEFNAIMKRHKKENKL